MRVFAAGGVVRTGKNTGDKGVPSGPGATGCVCLFPALAFRLE
jgi:hypothetical protein